MGKNTLSPSTKGNERKSWVKRIEKNGYTKSIRVEEIENGFLVCMEEYGDKNGKYFNIEKKYYSKDNPLADDDMVMDGGISDAIDSFLKSM